MISIVLILLGVLLVISTLILSNKLFLKKSTKSVAPSTTSLPFKLTIPSTKENRFVFLGDDQFHQTENLPLTKDLINFRNISIGNYHTLVIKNDGSLIAWGWNEYAQSTILSFPPDEKLYMVSAGELHSLALTDKGNVFVWGDNSRKQMEIPSNLKNVIKISAGKYYSLTLTNSNKVISYGETPNLPDIYNNDIIDIAAGGAYGISLALKKDGTVITWGYLNNNNLLNIPEGNEPQEVGLKIVTGLTNVKAIFTCEFCSIALYNNGSGIAWGNSSVVDNFNTYCQTNNDIKNIAVGFEFIIILKTNNRAKVFGNVSSSNIRNIENVENIDEIFAGGLNVGYTILT